MSKEFGDALGQPVVVVNQPGAAGNVAAADLVRSEPDGYKIFIATANLPVATWLPKNPPFDPATDFASAGWVGAMPTVITARPDLGVKTIEELVALAKSKPGELNYGTSGIGSILHAGTHAFAEETGIEIVHIPYRGGAAAGRALLAGEIDIFMAGTPPVLPHIKSGAVLALAVSSTERYPGLPDVPTLSETVMEGFSMVVWYGLLLPKDTPDEILTKVNTALNTALSDPAVAKRFENAGAVVHMSTPREFAELLAEESTRWKAQLEQMELVGSR
ncbi:MAG: tripartite tricarboxylate transporter substrate binding protein [Rhodospirillales bacterium]|nr:tripartite tricarboxylate transporter substrate binding protein [Rhodospirillales bacterium]